MKISKEKSSSKREKTIEAYPFLQGPTPGLRILLSKHTNVDAHRSIKHSFVKSCTNQRGLHQATSPTYKLCYPLKCKIRVLNLARSSSYRYIPGIYLLRPRSILEKSTFSRFKHGPCLRKTWKKGITEVMSCPREACWDGATSVDSSAHVISRFR